MKKASVVRSDVIERRILLIRGNKVLLDAHLAALYGVSTKVLVQAVKRNSARFPADFMYQLTDDEHSTLRSQSVTSKKGRGGRRYSPTGWNNITTNLTDVSFYNSSRTLPLKNTIDARKKNPYFG